MKIDKVAIVLANSAWTGHREFNAHPMVACILASTIKDKYAITIIDANADNLTIEDTVEELVQDKPHVVGVSIMSIEYSQTGHEFIKQLREAMPEAIIVLGGQYCTLLPEVAFKDPNIDYLILAEGEYRFKQLLEVIESGKGIEKLDGVAYRDNGENIIIKQTSYISDLDAIPFPAYELIDFKKYSMKHNKYSLYNDARYLPYGIMLSSRGCPFNCAFCCAKEFSGKACRMRSAENVLAEIDYLVTEYGVKEIIFLDDNLMVNRKRINTILNGIIERNYGLHWKATNVPTFALDAELLQLMRDSGCYQITLPIESGNQYVLDNIIHKPLKLNKALEIISKAKELDFEIGCLFVIGMPGETYDQILETINFADKIDVDWVVFSIATPLPKTEVYEISKAKGYLPDDFDYSDFKFFGLGKGAITTEEFTPNQLEMLRAIEWDRINFKTEKKKQKIALMNSITMLELENWRLSTRNNLGGIVKYEYEK